jgi:uncharacterized protein YecE (DUF72 family)
VRDDGVILIGTSGWQYEHWRGRFYPRDMAKARWLELFASHFPTVEVNNSFYRLPSEHAFAEWRARTPEGFVFAVKASRYITHVRRLNDPKEPVQLLWSRARALGPKLGPVLFQLPPSLPADAERLHGLLAALPDGMRAAVEFRHPSWMVKQVYELLDQAGAALVVADRPGVRVPEVTTGGWAYIRFHQGHPHAPGYAREKLRRWAERLANLPANDVFVYFNNDAGGAAIQDAYALTELLDGRGQEVRGPAA